MSRLVPAAVLTMVIGAAVGIAAAAPATAKPGGGTGVITLGEAEAMCAEMGGLLVIGGNVVASHLPDGIWEIDCPVGARADDLRCTIDWSQIPSRGKG